MLPLLAGLKNAKMMLQVGVLAYAGLMTWLWLGARDDIAAEKAACNARIAESAAEAENAVRAALTDAHKKERIRLIQQAENAALAQAQAEAARIEAESRPPIVKEVIREVSVENPCIDTAVPDAVLDSLRQ